MISLCLLGRPGLTAADGSAVGQGVLAQPKRLALLCYLALARPRGAQRRDKLVALLWPELDARRARRALRQSIYFLRKELGPEALQTTRGAVGLADGVFHVDVIDLEAAIASEDTGSALRHWGGDLLDGFFVRGSPGFERWLDEERLRLRDAMWTECLRASEVAESSGEQSRAIELAARAVSLRPLNEASSQRLIAAHASAGDRSAALEEYERLVALLDEEFTTAPSPDTRALAARIRRPSRPAEPHEPAAPRHPRERPEPIGVRGADRSDAQLASRSDGSTGRLILSVAALGALVALGALNVNRAPSAFTDRVPLVAVLPLEALTVGEEEAALTAGIHGQLIHLLERTGGDGLRVIARSSVAGYDTRPGQIEEVARDLGVDYVVTGSVRVSEIHAADPRVSVMLEVVDAESGVEVWSEMLDGPLTPASLTDLQTASIESISAALVVSIRNEELRRAADAGTHDSEAYLLYLRSWAVGSADAVPLLEEAVDRDPDFLLAHARLARGYGEVYQYRDRRPEVADLALAHARTAMEQDPASTHARLGLAWAQYRTEDLAGALETLNTVRGSLQGEHEYLVLRSYVVRRLGRWGDALESMSRALAVDPVNNSIKAQHAATLFALRRYEEAIPFYEQGGTRPAQLARARWALSGDVFALEVGEGVNSDFLRWDAAMYRGDWDVAMRRVRTLPGVRDGATIWQPRELLEAWVHEAAGRQVQASSWYVRAEARVRARLAAQPEDMRAMTTLALVHSGIGEHGAAIREARAAATAVPIATDIVQGPHHLFYLAAVLARAGEVERACAAIDELLSVPNMFNAQRVEHDYLFRSIASDDCFRDVIGKHEHRVFD